MSISLLALMLIAVEPARPTGIDVTSQQSLGDLQACITRAVMKIGRVTPVPIEGGVALDFQFQSIGFGGPGEPKMSWEIRDRSDARHLTIVYRHPISGKAASRAFADTAKRCFAEEYAAQMPAP